MGRLTSEVLPVRNLDPQLVSRLFEIFASHYECVTSAQFEADLQTKDYVILLRDHEGAPRGFSTQQILHASLDGKPVRAIFSGDTVIDRGAWGEQELVRGWCRFAGRVRSAESTRLFWFLISKGHRTYLYLPVFFHAYLPRRDATEDPELRQLRSQLAEEKFGAVWDPDDGLLRFGESRGHLSPELAEVPAGRVDDPDVRFFLAANPGYAHGDELVCIAEIAPANMRGLAARMVAEGEAVGPIENVDGR